MKISLDLEKMKMICKLESPDGGSSGCLTCPLKQTEACCTSLICLNNEDLEEINKIVYNYKIPTYSELFLKELSSQFCGNLIAENCAVWEVFKVVDNGQTDWHDPVSLDFLKKFYSEN